MSEHLSWEDHLNSTAETCHLKLHVIFSYSLCILIFFPHRCMIQSLITNSGDQKTSEQRSAEGKEIFENKSSAHQNKLSRNPSYAKKYEQVVTVLPFNIVLHQYILKWWRFSCLTARKWSKCRIFSATSFHFMTMFLGHPDEENFTSPFSPFRHAVSRLQYVPASLPAFYARTSISVDR